MLPLSRRKRARRKTYKAGPALHVRTMGTMNNSDDSRKHFGIIGQKFQLNQWFDEIPGNRKISIQFPLLPEYPDQNDA